jgi:hypothetical protein
MVFWSNRWQLRLAVAVIGPLVVSSAGCAAALPGLGPAVEQSADSTQQAAAPNQSQTPDRGSSPAVSCEFSDQRIAASVLRLGTAIVGRCSGEARTDTVSGVVEQQTTRGKFVVRPATSYTEFRDGSVSWFDCGWDVVQRPADASYSCSDPAPAEASQPQSAVPCEFKTGFARTVALFGTAVTGSCVENERFDQSTGLKEQLTTRGKLSWREGVRQITFSDGAFSWYDCGWGVVRHRADAGFSCPEKEPAATPPQERWPPPFAPTGLRDTASRVQGTPPSARAGHDLPEALTCQDGVAWREARLHMNDRVTLEGPVVGWFVNPRAPDGPLILDLGAASPDPLRVAVIIPAAVRAQFPEPPEQLYLNKRVCVTGQLKLAQSVARIDLDSPDAIVTAP